MLFDFKLFYYEIFLTNERWLFQMIELKCLVVGNTQLCLVRNYRIEKYLTLIGLDNTYLQTRKKKLKKNLSEFLRFEKFQSLLNDKNYDIF